ncbi:latent-transforming growth factor beta-binding protein 3-like isoform X2 [Liolophura sinensis]|uniref:latent-transforming growth factor beta-binding protein 3-like isoform X2 n=1 Tax=Liolophura sinensis TaxID=3198878 RepID=UPI0031581053
MKYQKPTRRWGEILIPLVILTSICVPGMEAMNCGKTTCGHGTSCVQGGCHCNQGYAGLRSVPESNVLFCSKSCWSQSCPDKTTCELVFLYTRASLVFKPLCECSSKDRSPSTGECVDFTADGCRWRCGYRATCVQGVCGCTEGSDIPISFPDRSLQFCLQRCGTGWGVCPVNTTCEKVGVRHVCLCSAGAQRSAKGQCLDIDECEKKPELCGNNAVCVNTEGNHRCACAEGYRQREGKEVGCNLDIDECTENATICGNNSVCTNTMGNYTCACAEGYRQRKDEEVGCSLDVDECADNQTICGNNSVCANTVGNYTCACAVGYRQTEGQEVGCNLDIDECTENPNTCGNNSVCVNTEGNYTCACEEGFKPKEGEELGCSKIATAAAASTAADSSALTIGLAVCIGGVVLLAVVVLAVVVVFRARNRSSGGIRECIGLEMQGKRSDVITHEYITTQSGQQRSGVTNPTYPVLPDVLGSSTQLPSGTDVRYEEVDLPPQAELNHDAQTLYSLAGNFDDQKPSENEHKDLYSDHKIADNKAKQMATEKSQASETSPSESTYNVLSKPHVKSSIATTNTADNYNTLYGLKPNDESLKNIEPGQAGYGNPHRNDDVQYDTTYSAVRQIGDNRAQLTSNGQQDGYEYDELKVQKV